MLNQVGDDSMIPLVQRVRASDLLLSVRSIRKRCRIHTKSSNSQLFIVIVNTTSADPCEARPSPAYNYYSQELGESCSTVTI